MPRIILSMRENDCYEHELYIREAEALMIIKRFVALRKFRKNLIKFSEYLLEDYIHPDSPYVKHVLIHSRKTSGLAYINRYDQLIILRK